MRNNLHDGPTEAFEILNGRVRRPSSRPKASLAAIQWAADRGGLSYGVFMQHLTVEDEAQIQTDYEAWRREIIVHQTQQVNITPSTDDFIISDDNV